MQAYTRENEQIIKQQLKYYTWAFGVAAVICAIPLVYQRTLGMGIRTNQDMFFLGLPFGAALSAGVTAFRTDPKTLHTRVLDSCKIKIQSLIIL